MKGPLLRVEDRWLVREKLIEKQRTLLSRQSDVQMEIDNYAHRKHLQLKLISWIAEKHLTSGDRLMGIVPFCLMVISMGAISPIFLERIIGLHYHEHGALWLGVFLGLGAILAFSVGAFASSNWAGHLQNDEMTEKYLERRYEILLREREELHHEIEEVAKLLDAPIEEGPYRTIEKP